MNRPTFEFQMIGLDGKYHKNLSRREERAS